MDDVDDRDRDKDTHQIVIPYRTGSQTLKRSSCHCNMRKVKMGSPKCSVLRGTYFPAMACASLIRLFSISTLCVK